jgi:hypothetical protein
MITEAAESVKTASTTLPEEEKFPQKLCIKEHIIAAAEIVRIASNGSRNFKMKLS